MVAEKNQDSLNINCDSEQPPKNRFGKNVKLGKGKHDRTSRLL